VSADVAIGDDMVMPADVASSGVADWHDVALGC